LPSTIEWLFARALPHLPDAWIERASGERPEIRGSRLDPRIALMARFAARETPFQHMTPAAARRTSGAALRLTTGRPRPLERVEHRLLPGPAGAIPARVYHPPGLDAPRPLLLYFHQGGCVIGDLDWCESFCSLLAETARCRVLSVDYRLGPEHRFPAAQDDALAAYAWAAAHAEEIGGDPRRLAVGGDSAGGGLSAMICHEMKRREGPTPVLQLLIYPWVVALADNQSYRDYALGWPLSADGMRWFVAHYLNDDAEREDPRMSPLLEEDFTGLPPAVVATAGFDPLRDEGAAYAEKLQKAGVPVRYRCYETLSHTFTAFGGAVPAARWALEEIAVDLERAFTGAPL
jgi:acetyl esterase/lipase